MMEPATHEYELARRARDGDRESLAELVERLRLRLFALAFAELRHYEDAQDALASALVQICLHVGELREPERVRPWMNSVVRNEARLVLRRRVSQPVETNLKEAGSFAEEGEPSLLRLDVERALRQLPRGEARALALFYMAGLPIHEIARRIGRPEGTIKRWLHLGRRHLATELEDYAPMKPEWTASIISTEIDPATLQNLTDALKAAGWSKVNVIDDFQTAARLRETGEDDAKEFHLPEPLKGSRFIILDEWISGRSVFELFAILKAAGEKRDFVAGVFLDSPAEQSTLFAAWAAGFDLCLTKPVDPGEFQRFAARIRESLAKNQAASPSGSSG